ncbi:MAG: DNA mismatch repair endonuclease MutL [Aquificae bacterium]|nr:DNA mismatch repair endonuclease MutL [Aquificota bacterium]
MFVRILPPEVRKKIAAGEVVESPADVVKELLENSLDAGASRIEIEIHKGGKRLIRVSDNGTGIHPEDIEKVVLEGATSKIQDEKDLLTVSTYGFRGEALYSISSVSRFLLRSRYYQEKEGREIEVEGGKFKAKRRCGMQVGTEVLVRDLFFNLPARRKFLRKEETERRKVLEVVREYALVKPQVEFILTAEGRRLLHLGKGELKERVEEIFGEIFEEYAEEGDVTLRVFLSRNAKQGKYLLFINDRPVHNRNLKEYLRKVFGYKTIVVLYAYLPPFAVDFNVHPKKKEVRILKERQFLERIRTLAGKERPLYEPPSLSQRSGTYRPTYEILGQLEETFILVKDSEYLYFLDQHLLEERINYEMSGDEELACRISLKAGRKLTAEEMRNLVKKWRELENPHVCPHGRPIYYRIPLREIYEKLGRSLN